MQQAWPRIHTICCRCPEYHIPYIYIIPLRTVCVCVCYVFVVVCNNVGQFGSACEWLKESGQLALLLVRMSLCMYKLIQCPHSLPDVLWAH